MRHVGPVALCVALCVSILNLPTAAAQSRNGRDSSTSSRSAFSSAQLRRLYGPNGTRTRGINQTNRAITPGARATGVLQRGPALRGASATRTTAPSHTAGSEHMTMAPGARADYAAIAAANRGNSAAAGAAYLQAAQLHREAGGPELWAAMTSAQSAAQHFERAGDPARAAQAREFATRVQSEIRSSGQTAMPPSR